jgi:hypothetical protein
MMVPIYQTTALSDSADDHNMITVRTHDAEANIRI